MDFKTATDRLMELGVPAREIAEALGLQPNTVRAMRLDPESGHHRTPPPNWQPELKKLAAARGGRLVKLAKELEE